MKYIISLLLLTASFNSTFADTQTESEQLARINSVLNALYPLIDAAQKAAPSNQRVSFHYDWLRSDIQSIQNGIAQKINQAPIEPRVVESLKTQYVALNDKTAG